MLVLSLVETYSNIAIYSVNKLELILQIIYSITPQAIREPAAPLGCELKSSAPA